MNKIERKFKLLGYLKLAEKYFVSIWCAVYCVTDLLKACNSQFRFFINIHVTEQRPALLH